MTIRNTYSAEAWDKVYNVFDQINFTSYDYDSVKESLLQYLKIYYAESFNDIIESSELVAILELFAYVAELLAYRVDLTSHENFITTAQRKSSILKLAKLISYRASRNIPARGLVKINTVQTSEAVYDSLGNNLANILISWNDPNNDNWKEQFNLVMNSIITSKIGQPQKSAQIADVLLQLYTFNNVNSAFKNNVFSYSTSGSGEQYPMEIVPLDIDSNGPFERSPDANSQMALAYASDGRGDGSDYTGFLMFTKQGTLLRTDYTIASATPNRRIELDAANVNDTDVWVFEVDDAGSILYTWTRVETLNEQNLAFNTTATSRKKYEVESLENDKIAIIFGDNNFSDAPVGNFQIWMRVSANASVTIPKNYVNSQSMAFNYVNATGTTHTASVTFSLISALQNNAPSEDIEHVRAAAPATYYSQNRMVNGQDYNTYPLKDPTILKLKTINRTFAGQPKYIDWNDASGQYQNIKVFGDDLTMYYDVASSFIESTESSRSLIDSYIEPLLQQNGVFNTLNHISATHKWGYGIISNPRRKFIESNRPIFKDGISKQSVNPYGTLSAGNNTLNEKTVLQGVIDRHWYGEPLSYTTINGVRHGVIDDPTTAFATNDGKLYDQNLRRTIDGVNTWPPADTGSGLQTFIASQNFFGIKYNRFLKAFGSLDISIYATKSSGDPVVGIAAYKDRIEVFTLEVQPDLTTITVISNIRGALPSGIIGTRYSAYVDNPVIDFYVPIANSDNGETPFAAGDAFILELKWSGLDSYSAASSSWTETGNWVYSTRDFEGESKINLYGWFEVIPAAALTAIDPTDPVSWARSALDLDPDDSVNSWIFLVKKNTDSSGNTTSFTVWYRDTRLVVESPTTKFWYNQSSQITDPETLKPVYDKIRILRSNVDSIGRPLYKNDIYDVVGSIYDSSGSLVPNKLEVLPSDAINFTQSGDGLPDNILQFENFSTDQYQFGIIDTDGVVTWLTCSQYSYVSNYDVKPYELKLYDTGTLTILSGAYAGSYDFTGGNTLSSDNNGIKVIRRRMMPGPCAVNGLDFMWQHFSPNTNLIDPSATNINDAFILTSGYYTAVNQYINGITDVVPTPPSALELRTSYGYLLDNKMMSDTVVLHSGKIKLLFGALAAPQLRVKFKVVKLPTATYSDEKIKTEIINVINTYFSISNWDFGDSFYATSLITLIHQRLSSQIASVIPVPLYSVNSFGALFSIDSGYDEVLQSCATVNDIEIIDSLTPASMRLLR